jgi:hypothetical protein
MSAPENHVLRDFLLHRLGEADAHALEERLMTEDGFLEALQDAEHDLLDDYAAGQLTGEDRAAVERYLLATPEARQRLEMGRALARARSKPQARVQARARPRYRRTWQLAFAAAACVAIVAFLVPSRFSTVDTNKRTELLLLADSSRSTSSRVIDIDTGAAEVALQVEIPSASATSTYSVELLDATGRRTHEAHDLRAQDVSGYSVVQLTVPGSVFQSGPHTIVLRESQSAAPAAEVFRWQININRR